MLTGKVIEESKIGNYSVIFRYPKFEDFEDTLKYINSLVEERVYIDMHKKMSKKGELKFLTLLLRNIENREAVSLVAEVNGKVGGLVNINKGVHAENHIGNLGIGLEKGIRGKGIGKKLIKLAINEAKKNLKTEIVELDVYAENKVALNLYKKSGFKKVGIVKKGSKKNGKYSDRILMVKYL